MEDEEALCQCRCGSDRWFWWIDGVMECAECHRCYSYTVDIEDEDLPAVTHIAPERVQ